MQISLLVITKGIVTLLTAMLHHESVFFVGTTSEQSPGNRNCKGQIESSIHHSHPKGREKATGDMRKFNNL